MRAVVLGPWYRETITDQEGHSYTTDHHNGTRCPAVAVAYPLDYCEDITGQAAGNVDPDLHGVACLVEATGPVLKDLAADPKYHVVWVAGLTTANEVMPDTQYAALGQWLIARGLTLAKARTVLGGSTVSGRTRLVVLARLVTWLRSRTRANATSAT